MKNIIRIGTRGSKLALYQAYRVKEELQNWFTDTNFEIVIIKTKGDKILDVPLSKIGDKGLFTKELEVALLNHEIDFGMDASKYKAGNRTWLGGIFSKTLIPFYGISIVSTLIVMFLIGGCHG